jgi:hypothetical protein
MRTVPTEESGIERVLSLVTLAVFWTAFICLAAGLMIWLTVPAGTPGPAFLATGFVGLLILPMLRVGAAIASAAATRDWITLTAALAVLAILCALTLRDAATLR